MLHGIASNQDKQAYCVLGEATEKQFLLNSFGSGVSFAMNPAKHENKYTHDLFAMLPCDLKTQWTPFRTADRYGIDPEFAVTINEKDLVRYGKLYPHIVVLIDVQFPHYKATHYAPLFVLRDLVKEKRARRHEYQERVNDQAGNAKASYVFDVRWFPVIGKPEWLQNQQPNEAGEYTW